MKPDDCAVKRTACFCGRFICKKLTDTTGKASNIHADTAENKGWDAAKKISGIKRRIGADTNGLPHVIHVTTADITDRSGALEAFTLHRDNLAGVVNVMADSAYSGEPFASSVKEAVECLC